ncbi:LCP family protein [Actinoplanes sp. KI2]|uniref:LCP family protein n=1 Tax=Actinoplanes sp. KI2 TaxID=2983315 RepID=UPI0021D5A1C4|nr:LCP family protein [Actinoplanes sp. KI2]MCU7727737.1 LCP family protein [Actinoplanes sp. KI2]
MPKVVGAGRRRSPVWARWLIGVGALLLVVSGGAIIATRVLINSATNAIQQQSLLGEAQDADQRAHAQITGAKNILLVGLDTRPSWAKTGELSRSDSIILLHVPADRSGAYMISLPRDSYVRIPAYDNGAQRYAGGKNKINSAFAYGSRGLTGAAAESHGFELLALTVKNLTGITPDAAAIIDFSGFTKVLQVLGKVCMYVDENVTSIHIGHTADGKPAVPYKTDSAGANPRKVPGVTPNFYPKGNHCFTPTEALDYARQRDLLANHDSDYGRQRHQQQLLKAILKQTVHEGLTSPTKLPGLLTAIGKTMTVDSGGISLEDWAFAMKGIDPDQITTLKTNGGKFNSRSVPGIGDVEILDATSMAMLRAAKDDDLAAFVAAHPTWVASS